MQTRAGAGHAGRFRRPDARRPSELGGAVMAAPADAALPVELDERLHAAVVRVYGDLDAALAPALRQVLADAVDRHSDVVVDLAHAPTVDPAGLSLLVRAHRHARRCDGTMCFVAPSRYVLTVLHTMRAGP
jgi:anti-anti-sigma factor